MLNQTSSTNVMWSSVAVAVVVVEFVLAKIESLTVTLTMEVAVAACDWTITQKIAFDDTVDSCS